MDILIVTGMSGAGKTRAVNALEDLGYYCVDNVPPKLLTSFAELADPAKGTFSAIALVVDARSREMFSDYKQGLKALKNLGYEAKTLFLDCADNVLINRYKETRRLHPLLTGNTVSIGAAIAEERALLQYARVNADYIMDTSQLSATQLKSMIVELFSGDTGGMAISCTSFGFKHGVPADSDLVFDVRCLPNPFYVDDLRGKTGLDTAVKDYVLSYEQAKGLIPKLFDLVDYLILLYIDEGKSQLVISLGCTGGKHRSVVFAELLAEHLRQKGYHPNCYHRHIAME